MEAREAVAREEIRDVVTRHTHASRMAAGHARPENADASGLPASDLATRGEGA